MHLIFRKRPAKDSIGCSRAMAPVCEMVSVILRSFQGLLETGRDVVLAFLNRSVMWKTLDLKPQILALNPKPRIVLP